MNYMNFPNHIFITGTDTGVGKTFVSAILTAGFMGFYWKPIQSGLEGGTDTEWVRQKTGLEDDHFFRETYRFNMPLSPHEAAVHDGVKIDLEAFHVPEAPKSEQLIIEGAGGVMVPLNDKHLMTDLIKRLNSPVLLVARSSLGTINHTLLSLEQLRREGIDVIGIVMNGPRNEGNRQAIERYGRIKVIAEIEPVMDMDINPENLRILFKYYFGQVFPWRVE
ncbi:MAG: dethiobiotin synthase, partial [Deltaproteobacteria bacterium]|nr:dethiobiotin synthase [Deltaproteobacteria bacterium]